MTLKDITKMTYNEVECLGCKKGESFCDRPCWPTPEEVEKLIDAGYSDKLMLDYWVNHKTGDIEILSPAIPGYEKQEAPFFPRGGCVMQDDCKLCTLHDKGLKPYEGRVACCKIDGQAYNLHEFVAMKWDTEKGKAIVHKWKKLIK